MPSTRDRNARWSCEPADGPGLLSLAGPVLRLGPVLGLGPTLGLGLGPTYVGAASDWFAAHGQSHPLQSALYTLTPFYGVAILIFLWLARTLRREGAAA